MRKISVVLIISVILILSAGCVAETDKIIGTWETVEPYQEGDYSLNYAVTFNEDNSGEIVETYSDGLGGTFPSIWKKTGENTYLLEKVDVFYLSDDGKTLTSCNGYKYYGGNGFTNGTWVQTGTGDEYHYESVFYSNGTGVETLFEGDYIQTYDVVWKDFGDNMYEVAFIWTVDFSDDGKTMYDTWGDSYSESNGVWKQDIIDDLDYYYTYEFLGDGLCKSVYHSISGEALGTYYYEYMDSESENEMILIEVGLTNIELQSDGTIKDLERSVVLKKVSDSSSSGVLR